MLTLTMSVNGTGLGTCAITHSVSVFSNQLWLSAEMSINS